MKLAHLLEHLGELKRHTKQWPKNVKVIDEQRFIESRLRSWGARRIGRGAFGAVYKIGNLAVKRIRTRENTSYISFARYCRAAKSRLLPKIYKITQLGRHTIVVMETLEENRPLAKQVAKAFKLRLKNACNQQQVWGQAVAAAGRHCRFVEIHLKKIEAIMDKSARSTWDIHDQNLLFRKEKGKLRMVLSDPITW